MSEPSIEISGLTPKQVRHVADIADALTADGVDVLAIKDAREWELDPPRCADCNRTLEAGHCYYCRPVWGYRATPQGGEKE